MKPEKAPISDWKWRGFPSFLTLVIGLGQGITWRSLQASWETSEEWRFTSPAVDWVIYGPLDAIVNSIIPRHELCSLVLMEVLVQ